MTSQILLFDQPRAASQFFARVLGNVDGLVVDDNIFGEPRGLQVQWLSGPSKPPSPMAPEAAEAFENAVKKALATWEDKFEQAQKANKALLLLTHTFSAAQPEALIRYLDIAKGKQSTPKDGENFTLVPDALLLRPGTVPILNIRNPRVAVPSAYRVLKSFDLPLAGSEESFLIATTMAFNRALYHFFITNGVQPLIVDADDIMTSEAYVRHVCAVAGLDPAQALLSWPAVTPEEKAKIHPMQYLSQKNLYESTGIMPSRAYKNRNLEEEMKQWPADFGEHLPIVEEMIRLAMPDYDYLYEKRLKM